MMQRHCALTISILFILFAYTLPVRAAIDPMLDYKEVTAISMAIESIELEGRKDFFLPPGTKGQLVATTSPDGLEIEVNWEIAGQSEKVKIELVRDTGLIKVLPDSGTGWIMVRALAEGCLPLEQRIDIDCKCSGKAGPCESPAGAGEVNIGSVDVRLSLGKVAGGRSAGDLFLYAKEPLAILSTPEALVINSSSDQVDPVYRDGILEQIVTPQAIVNFIRYSSLKYEVHFYDFSFRGKKLEDGSYSIDPTAVPQAVWRIENPDETGKTTNQLSVTEIKDGNEREFYYTYEAAESTWSLVSGNGLKIESRSETINEAGDRVVRTTVADADGQTVQVEETVYREFEFGEQTVRETIDPEGANLTTEYHFQTSSGPGYGKLAARIDRDGGWVRYAYDSEGRIIQEVRPFLDAPIDSPESKTVVVDKSYASEGKADSGAEQDRNKPRRIIKFVNGIEVARSYYVYTQEQDGSRTEISERCTRQGSPYGHPTNLKTVTRYYPSKGDGLQAGKIKSRLSEEGRLSTTTYEKGQFRMSPDPARCVFIPGKGDAVRTTVTHGTAEHPDGIPFVTTRETTIVDAQGREKMQESFVCTEDGFVRIDWRFNTHDHLGKVIETLHANGTRTENEWGCCGKLSETNVEGIATRYTYDDLKRVVAQTNEATGVVTSYTYDAADRRLSATESKDGLSLSRESRYDTAGRLAAQVNAAGLVTRFAASKRVSATTHPGGATEITTHHLDGQMSSITGTGLVPRFYRYGVDTDGKQWTTVYIGNENSPRWKKTVRNLVGRAVRVEKPGFSGIEITRNLYDTKGRLVRTDTPGQAATFYEYDALGNITRAGLDVDDDGKLTPASMDRIAVTETGFKQIGNGWWQERTLSIYSHDNKAIETIVSIQRKRLTGWKGGMISEGVAIDIHGNETRSVMAQDRFKRTRTQTIYAPDSDTPMQAVYVDGRLAATTNKTGITMTYGYDALGRRIAVKDPRKGVSRLHYDEKGRIDYVEDAAGNRARFEYDSETGRRIAEINALNKATHYDYNLRGQLIRTWGDVPYPVQYAYDAFGQMNVIRTFRGGQGWDGNFWPADTGIGDQTIWHYQWDTGLLLAKEDAKGRRTQYSYGTNGALSTRTWARLINGKPLLTSYRYDHATGDLTGIDYSDDTPDITFAYDRLGRKVRVNDAAGVHSFSYDEKLRLVNEGLTGQQIYQINRKYDDLGRTSGMTLDDNYKVAYGYDDTGRFADVDWRIDDQTGDVEYRYMTQSNRLSGMESTSGLSVRYDYEPNRDVKAAIENRFNDRLISRYEYQYDRLGRRINAKTSGKAFKEDGFWLYGYNDRNEVTSANWFSGGDLKNQTKPIPELERMYQFDPIGNRISAVEGQSEIKYQTNSLNQYEDIKRSSEAEEGLSYDEDGNLIKDGRYFYTWNAENRLVAIEPIIPEAGKKRLTFAYDYMGRRIVKKIYALVGNGYELSAVIHFVYDGWNMVKERKTENETTVDRCYMWGLDISQSIQGAGGAGGLIASSDGSSTYAYVYDANGNVGQFIDVNNGSVGASYEYDPFGELSIYTGLFALKHPYRFSTKYLDNETGLNYYGYRYYHNDTGRWMKRDPIGESGGKNLYGFIKNSVMNYVDCWGLVLVAVDGTDSRNWAEELGNGKWNSHVRNFYEDYRLQIGEKKRYWDGPDLKITGWDAFTIHKEVKEFLKNVLSEDRCQRINLIGHSRGGYIVMEMARELGMLGVVLKDGSTIMPRVKFLGLYDAVDMVLGYGEKETIPINVDYGAHAMGLDSVGSRPYFNTADHGPENELKMIYYDEEFFDATHSGLGGSPWGGDHPTGMTEERDRIGSGKADNWMRDQASNAGIF